MPQFLVDKEDIDRSAGHATIRGEEARHLISSLRARAGDPVMIFNGEGGRWQGEISAVLQGEVSIINLNDLPDGEPKAEVILAQSLIKGERWEWLLEKATELGATKIVPLNAKHSVVSISDGKAEKKMSRWNKLLLAAAKQCERGRIPQIAPPIDLNKFLKELGPPTLGEARFVLAERYEDDKNPINEGGSIVIAIGPEGGWDAEEIEALSSYGFVKLSLGRRILRSETAALAALSKLAW